MPETHTEKNWTSQDLPYYSSADENVEILTTVQSSYFMNTVIIIVFIIVMSISYFNDFTLFYRRGSKWD